MTNFEKIDDYLANRLPAEEREAFEREISGDPALQEEVVFQQKIVAAVRHARAAELKQMLSHVPVPSGGWSGGSIAAGVIAVGVVATSLYIYLGSDEPAPTPAREVPQVIVEPQPSAEPATTETKQEESTPTIEGTKKAESPKTKTVSPVKKPDIQVVDPSADLTESSDPSTVSSPGKTTTMTVSKMEVMTTPSDKKYNFHYQFANGKLMLFGPFDSSLYEILEINGDSHAVFLFYKENYYLLDEGQAAITALAPIRDGQLLKKLREYRSR